MSEFDSENFNTNSGSDSENASGASGAAGDAGTKADGSSVYSYSYSDINQGETDTKDTQTEGQTYRTGTYESQFTSHQESRGAGGSNPYSNSYGNNSENNNAYNGNAYNGNAYNGNSYNENPYGRNNGGNRKHRRAKKPAFFTTGHFGNKLIKVAAIALVFGLVAGGAFSGITYGISKATGKDMTVSSAVKTLSGSSVDGTAVSTATTVSDVSDIVDNVMPSIVAVTNVSYTEYRSMFGASKTYESTSAGSGIIVGQDSDYLYIATNNHVVSGAESLTITFDDETAAPATVKGTDSSNDLAVVAVALSDIENDTLDNIKVATLGDSDDLKVGESSVVIGNALGYGQSVTTGVISALSREVTLQDDSGNEITSTLMQTDAAVNPGNSGGALLNMKGEVVGIVSAKYSSTSVEGMGYAIPITTAKDIIEQIINQEQVSEDEASYFGIAGVDVASDVSQQYDMPAGVYVTRVVSGSGASKAGIKKGDIIVSFNGKSVSSMDEISEAMTYLKAGTTVEVVVAQASNNYEETTLSVTLTSKN